MSTVLGTGRGTQLSDDRAHRVPSGVSANPRSINGAIHSPGVGPGALAARMGVIKWHFVFSMENLMTQQENDPGAGVTDLRGAAQNYICLAWLSDD